MGIRFNEYNNGYQLVSLALNDEVKEKLLSLDLNVLYVGKSEIVLLPANIVLSTSFADIEYFHQYNNFDVLEIWGNGVVVRRYNDNSTDNYFFITSGCNSNCIMCPSPEATRRKREDASVDELITYAKYIPSDAPHLTITGGEPFLIGEKIFDFIKALKQKFVHTEFLFLTNGRVFSIKKYVDLFIQNIPKYSMVAIPIHGASDIIHDEITRSKNSLQQTKIGIKNLLKNNISVEIRIVVNKLNINDFGNIAKMICTELRGIEYVSVIAMEMTGCARINKEEVWMPYKETFDKIAYYIRYLIEQGIDVKLYNFPLCTVDSSFWTLCEKSISESKVRYAETCDRCKYKKNCGGVFAGTFDLESEELEAIL